MISLDDDESVKETAHLRQPPANTRRLRPSIVRLDAGQGRAHGLTDDRRVHTRVSALIKDILRNGNEGIGKPEALRHGFHGYRSRRIIAVHRWR